MAKQRTVTRNRAPKWNNTVDRQGRRHSTGKGGKRRRSVPVIEGIVAVIELPQGFTPRNTRGQLNHPDGINYEEYQLLITDHHNPAKDSFVKINSFLGPDAAGKKVKAKIKVGTEEHSVPGKDGTFIVYYLKIEPVDEDELVTHHIEIFRNRLAIDDAISMYGAVTHELGMDPEISREKVLMCDAAHLNPNMDGAIMIVSEEALSRLEADLAESEDD